MEKVERKRIGKGRRRKGWNGRRGASRPGLIKLDGSQAWDSNG